MRNFDYLFHVGRLNDILVGFKKYLTLMCRVEFDFWFVDGIVGSLVRHIDDRGYHVSVRHTIRTCRFSKFPYHVFSSVDDDV